MPRRLQKLPVAALAIGAAFLAQAGPAGATQESPSALLAESLQAANGSGSFSFTDKTVVGKDVQVEDGAISAPTASETLSGNGAPLRIELLGGNLYVTGNAIALEASLEITATQATPAAGKWILVKPTDAPFQDIVGTLTVSSTLNEFTPTGALHMGKQRTVHGTKVIAITGTPTGLSKGTAGNASLLVRASAPHLPVAGTLVLASKKSRLNEVAAFTAWGAQVNVTPPTDPLPFTTVLSY